MTYPDDFINKVIQGDCLEVMKQIPDESIDLILTDPPYNVGYSYNEYKDNLSGREYLDWQFDVLREAERLLKPDGSLFYLNYPEVNCEIYVGLKEDFSLKPLEIITWVYNTHTQGNPLRKASRTWIWSSKGEPINNFKGEYKNPTDARVLELIKNGGRPKEQDWWRCEQVKNVSPEKTEHPCQIPIEMVMKIIEGATERDAVVLDPFLGSGTTGIAAKKLNRNFIGVESSKDYCDIAKKMIGGVTPSMF